VPSERQLAGIGDSSRITSPEHTTRRASVSSLLTPTLPISTAVITTICPQYDGSETISERHRHRYEFNNAYRQQLAEAGLVASGTSPDGSLVEISEIADHPFMVGSQFHPEFRSRPDRPQPLFRDFIGVAKSLQDAREAGLLSPERQKVAAASAATE